MQKGLQWLTIASWVGRLEWNEEEVDLFIAKIKSEWKDRNIHIYVPLWVIWSVAKAELTSQRYAGSGEKPNA